MAKQSLLVADADPRSLRILDVALRKAGFQVGTASDGAEALRRVQRDPPDLLLADVMLPGTDGVALCRAVRADSRLAGTPIILISGSKEAALKLSAHEAGADDFLGKPLLIKELTTRIRMLLTRREQQRLSQRGSEGTLTGAIGEMGLVDLFQSLDANGRSAIIACADAEHTAQIWVRDGQVIDAEAGALAGEAAFYRVLGWEGGTFSAHFAPVEREPRISQGTQGLLAESVRRVDELERLAQELPLSTVLSVDFPALSRRLADLPDEVNGVIRLCDGVRTIAQVMERAPLDELSVLAVLQRLLGEGVLLRVQAAPGPKAKPSLSQWLGPDSVATPAPPIMGAHGFPQSGDPTPIAPPVSDPPLPARPAAILRGSADSPQLMFDTPVDPIPAPMFHTPAEPIRSPVFDTPADPIRSPLFDTPADPVRAPSIPPAAQPSAPQAPPVKSVPPPQHTDLFKLPAVPKAAVPLVQFAPLRGVRRERLRREADEARAQVAEGRPVRLTHVVELPVWPANAPDPRRRISPAVGEAAKKYAPDVPMGSPEGAVISAAESVQRFLVPEAELEQPSPPRPAVQATAHPDADDATPARPMQPVIDDRDQLVESATLQVEPLSAEALAGPAPVASTGSIAPAPGAAPAVEPGAGAPATAPAGEPAAVSEGLASRERSAWSESADPLAAAPLHEASTSPGHPIDADGEVLSHDAPTSPGHRIELGAGAEPATAARIEEPAVSSPAPASSPSAMPVAEAAAPSAALAEGAPASAPSEPEGARTGSAAAATVEAAPSKPPVPSKTPAPEPAALSSDAEFDAELRAALGKNKKRRWPIYLAVAAVAVAAFLVLRAQPPTDKRDSPWLGEHAAGASAAAHKATPAAAAVVPSPAPALDGGVAVQANADAGTPARAADAGALAAAPAAAPASAAAPAAAVPAEPIDAGAAAAPGAPPADDYARALASGESLLKRGKYRPAVVELKKAVALSPESVPALLELGDAWLESDQPRSALKPLEKASKLDPRSSRAQLLLGTAWQSLGKTPDAVKAYQRYLEMDPSGEYARDVRSILANLQK